MKAKYAAQIRIGIRKAKYLVYLLDEKSEQDILWQFRAFVEQNPQFLPRSAFIRTFGPLARKWQEDESVDGFARVHRGLKLIGILFGMSAINREVEPR